MAEHKKLTILDDDGHINACLSLAQILFERGHRVIFVIDIAWKGKFSKQGFEEEITCIADPNEKGDSG